jgi:hypothetical protein
MSKSSKFISCDSTGALDIGNSESPRSRCHANSRRLRAGWCRSDYINITDRQQQSQSKLQPCRCDDERFGNLHSKSTHRQPKTLDVTRLRATETLIDRSFTQPQNIKNKNMAIPTDPPIHAFTIHSHTLGAALTYETNPSVHCNPCENNQYCIP